MTSYLLRFFYLVRCTGYSFGCMLNFGRFYMIIYIISLVFKKTFNYHIIQMTNCNFLWKVIWFENWQKTDINTFFNLNILLLVCKDSPLIYSYYMYMMNYLNLYNNYIYLYSLQLFHSWLKYSDCESKKHLALHVLLVCLSFLNIVTWYH